MVNEHAGRVDPFTVSVTDTTSALLASQIKTGLNYRQNQSTTDKTSLLQTKAHDISFDKSILLQCGGDSRSLRASSIEQSPKSFLASYMYMGKLCSHCALGLKSVPAILWLQTCKMEIRDRQHAKNVPEDSFVLRAARNGSVDLVKNCIKRGCTMYVTLTTNQLKV